jgi:hypothetical protein
MGPPDAANATELTTNANAGKSKEENTLRRF